MKLSAFWDLLDKHDWYTDYSDDHTVWEKGMAERQKLIRISNESREHKELFQCFSWHKTTGRPWGTVQVPKPKRPED